MLGGKREGVDAAKLTVWCILDELFDRVHRLRLRRLSQNSEEGFGFSGKFHGIIGLITVAVTVWLRKNGKQVTDGAKLHLRRYPFLLLSIFRIQVVRIGSLRNVIVA